MTNVAEIVKAYAHHMANEDFAKAFSMFSSDASYIIAGETPVAIRLQGRERIIEGLSEIVSKYFKLPPKIIIDDVITEGDRGVILAHGSGEGLYGPYHQTYTFILRVIEGTVAEVKEIADSLPIQLALIGNRLVAR